jgi:excisionase family DNA binding protein
MLSQLMPTSENKDVKNLPDILTLQQACDVLNCHPNTLRQWDNKGVLKAIRFGARRDRRYKKNDILQLLNQK